MQVSAIKLIYGIGGGNPVIRSGYGRFKYLNIKLIKTKTIRTGIKLKRFVIITQTPGAKIKHTIQVIAVSA
jgi:hypothetical protein